MTVSPVVDFAKIALACNYRAAYSCDSVDGFAEALRAALAAQGPVMIHLRIAPGSMKDLGRPTVHPSEVARRFKTFLAEK
jgi:phosphonopyruvate decarboxylase